MKINRKIVPTNLATTRLRRLKSESALLAMYAFPYEECARRSRRSNTGIDNKQQQKKPGQ